MIDPLIDLITEYNMQISLPLGIQTFETTTSNWTHLDNIWCKDTLINPITICNVDPSIWPPLADHLLIVMVLNLPVQRANVLFLTDFKVRNQKLSVLIAQQCPTKTIWSKEELENMVNHLINSIQEVLNQEVLVTKPCTYMKRWWTNELTDLKRLKNKLSKQAYCFRGTPDHPSHIEHKAVARNLKICIETTKKLHWTNWLKEVLINDIYTGNKYINGEPTDYSNNQIPT